VKPAGGGGPTYQLAKEFIYANGKLVATEEPPSATCSYSLNLTFQSFPAIAGSGSVTVSTQGGCNWTAASNAPSWLSVTSGANGTGNGTVQFSVAANTGGIRDATLTIAGQTFTVYQGRDFTDVPHSHPFYNEISRLSSRGVTLGCSTNTYCPTDPVTREQMAAFIIRALGEFSPPTPATQRFTDVAPSNPFYNFIDRMAVLNITLGCGTNTYCPLQTVTHEQMAAFMIRALGMPNPPPPQTQRFADVAPSNISFYAFIDQMAERNIWTGCQVTPVAMYCPLSNVTREQMAVMLVRAFNL
jgi:hypothetical protein